MKPIGIILIIAAMFMLSFHVLEFPGQKKLVDISPVEKNEEENKTIQWPIYGGGLALIAGLVFIALGKRKNK